MSGLAADIWLWKGGNTNPSTRFRETLAQTPRRDTDAFALA